MLSKELYKDNEGNIVRLDKNGKSIPVTRGSALTKKLIARERIDEKEWKGRQTGAIARRLKQAENKKSKENKKIIELMSQESDDFLDRMIEREQAR